MKRTGKSNLTIAAVLAVILCLCPVLTLPATAANTASECEAALGYVEKAQTLILADIEANGISIGLFLDQALGILEEDSAAAKCITNAK